tara:strand:- start:389 stop:2008 length:1620 start_codon:yes stop_codon:yes gene_type:complete
MNGGPPNISRQINKGLDYIQSSYNVADGVTQETPTLIFKGIVIDVDFKALKSTTFASLVPPFSVYAKIIGMDEDVENPLSTQDKIYYPPLFPMHTICIPEIGEEVMILKESPDVSSQGYYIGRINDSSPLNISYARDYVGINDPETDNKFRYGFSFDVRELREKFIKRMPSDEYSNVSIPMTYGDVVQQGRSKTYVRHSFNRNNKKGVLEQGIRMDGQLLSRDQVNSFDYELPEEDAAGPREGENGELIQTPQMLRSVDPSIGITKTKTIHFVDSSIKRLGDYTYQSFYGDKQTGTLAGEDKGMIVNIAEEIYNISSRNDSGALYRQVLGEKLVIQQQQSLNLMKEVMNTVSDFAASTQVLLDAFLDHTHALPKIDLNLEKTIDVKDTYRTPPILEQQPNLTVNLPGRVVQVPVPGGGTRGVYVAGGKTSIPQPPKVVSTGQRRTRTRKQEINFEAIIGGSENPRFTAPVQTDKAPTEASSSLPGQQRENQQKTELGVKTGKVDVGLESVISKFTRQRKRLNELTLKVNQFLSKNQFVN